MSNPDSHGGLSEGWRPHHIRQGDGEGGWVLKPAQCRILRYREKGWTAGFGLARMDNGEIALLGICDPGKSLWYGGGQGEKTLIAFSTDRGETWSDLDPIPGLTGRPMMLAYLGEGNLTFVSEGIRYFSSDYGRTWPERVEVPKAANGGPWHTEGNPLVERDQRRSVIRMAEIGYNFGPGGRWSPRKPLPTFIRWSCDGGRTWTDEVEPPPWRWMDNFKGETFTRSGDEGALARAPNGWLVAALRTTVPPRYLDGPHDDSLTGTGISISRDDGKTWSVVKELYDAGRHHATLSAMPNGDILMTITVRADIQDGRLVSYRRGCEAIVSHDNGLTWDLEGKYILDEWEFFDSFNPVSAQCGHLCSVLLDDGAVLTAHNNYLTMGITLIRWHP